MLMDCLLLVISLMMAAGLTGNLDDLQRGDVAGLPLLVWTLPVWVIWLAVAARPHGPFPTVGQVPGSGVAR